MSRVMLDTHSFLWFVTADPKLSAPAQRIIAIGSNELLLSMACLWKMGIKISLGKLE
jgi:PIN domain nuclease of toxin-antitoxin system